MFYLSFVKSVADRQLAAIGLIEIMKQLTGISK